MQSVEYGRIEDSKKENRQLFWIPAVAGFILMAAPVLFLENETAVTVCSLSGYCMFLIAERMALKRRQLLLTMALFALSFGLRYGASFGDDPYYLPLAVAVALLVGILNALVLLADHLLIRRDHRLLAIPAVPVAYTLIQYLLHAIGLGNYYDPLGYAMLVPLYSMNLARIGEYGLMFATALILSLIADGVSRNGKNRNAAGLLVALFLAAALTLTGGLLKRKEKAPDDVLHVAVGLSFEDDMLGERMDLYPAEERKELFRKSMETAAENHADLLVLHEEYYAVRKSREDEVMEEISETVRAYGIPVLVCFFVWGEDTEKSVNRAVLFDAQGEIRMNYVKNNLIPFIETSEVVDGPEEPGVCSLELGGIEINIATVICFDQNDPEYIHKVPENTELLLIPAWEWDTTNLEQRRLRMRSVELNTTVLKHTFEGYTFASGPWGQYGEMIDNRGVYETVQMIEVPVWLK